jgi:tRNA U38,U39,U40 pseudouridine synthase TruA
MTVIKRALEPLMGLQKCASFTANRLWEKTSKRTIAKFT